MIITRIQLVQLLRVRWILERIRAYDSRRLPEKIKITVSHQKHIRKLRMPL